MLHARHRNGVSPLPGPFPKRCANFGNESESRLLQTREGVPFCGFRFLPGQRPRILGGTKRRFERRRRAWARLRDFRRLSATVFAWYQFSREGNTTGLRRAYARARRGPCIVER